MIPCWLEAASAAGQAIGGLATAVGVGFAVHQFKAWRGRKVAEARSEPASFALVQVHEVCSFVHNWCTLMQIAEAGQSPPGEVSGGASDGVPWGRRSVGPLLGALERAQTLAYVHLDEPERKLIWEAKGLLIQAKMEADQLERAITPIPAERVHDVLGGLVRAADALRVKADLVLRPIARFGRPEEVVATGQGN